MVLMTTLSCQLDIRSGKMSTVNFAKFIIPQRFTKIVFFLSISHPFIHRLRKLQMSAAASFNTDNVQNLCNCTARILKKCSEGILAHQHSEFITRKLQTRTRIEDENADLYSVVILCLFAGVILMLMIRAIKPSETLNDQVNTLLNSMRTRCELDEAERRRVKMREAKRKVQRWLAEAKAKSVRKLSFRIRTTSAYNCAVHAVATKDNHGPTKDSKNLLLHMFSSNAKQQKSMQIRAASSYQLKAIGGTAVSNGNAIGIRLMRQRANSSCLLAPEIVVTGSLSPNGTEESCFLHGRRAT